MTDEQPAVPQVSASPEPDLPLSPSAPISGVITGAAASHGSPSRHRDRVHAKRRDLVPPKRKWLAGTVGAVIVLGVVITAGQALTMYRASSPTPTPKGTGTTDAVEVCRDLEGSWELVPDDARAGTGLRFVFNGAAQSMTFVAGGAGKRSETIITKAQRSVAGQYTIVTEDRWSRKTLVLTPDQGTGGQKRFRVLWNMPDGVTLDGWLQNRQQK